MTPTLNHDTTKNAGLGYNKTTRSFYVEASELPYKQLPTSFWIYSVKTGVKKLFTLTKTVRDGEGDCRYWEYAGPGGFKLTVFND